MRPTVLLFDIDGTLVTTGGAGRRAFERAFSWRFGTAPRDTGALGFSFAGMTDRAIARDALAVLASHLSGAELEAEIDACLKMYITALADEAARSLEFRVHKGVNEALERACGAYQTAVGLGTGNIIDGARIKLERVGVYHRFEFGGFGSDHIHRPTLLRIGAERGAARLGYPLEACRVVVIGDTPKDIDAARVIGAESIAVATGTFRVDELRAHEPTLVVENLAAPEAVEALHGRGDMLR